jgi:hypothetical protein
MNFRRDHYIEPWKVFALTFFTLGFYQFYWSFYTWKFIKEETGVKINPLLRTMAQVLPIIPIALLFYDVLLVVTKLSRKFALFVSLLLAIMVLVYTNDIREAHIGYALKILFLILELLFASIAFTLVQKRINKYVTNRVDEKQLSLTKKKNPTDIIIFPISITSYLIVLIIIASTRLDGNFYVLTSTMISTIITVTIVEIYEKKKRKE